MRAARGRAAVALAALLAAGCSRQAPPPGAQQVLPPGSRGDPAGGAAGVSEQDTSGESTPGVPQPQPVRVPADERSGAPAARPADHGAGGGGNSATGRAGPSNPFDEQGRTGAAGAAGAECQSDGDCACGIEHSTGRCAVGPAARIDTSRQCPDFCSGIDGRMRTVCEAGRCVQRR